MFAQLYMHSCWQACSRRGDRAASGRWRSAARAGGRPACRGLQGSSLGEQHAAVGMFVFILQGKQETRDYAKGRRRVLLLHPPQTTTGAQPGSILDTSDKHPTKPRPAVGRTSCGALAPYLHSNAARMAASQLAQLTIGFLERCGSVGVAIAGEPPLFAQRLPQSQAAIG
jgi:hypothetical protein